jgi:hypothetical protein
LFNFGIEDEEIFYSITYSAFRPSLMADYPDNYKFTSIDLGVSTSIKKTERTTFDLLQLFGDVGGVNEFAKIVVGTLLSGFAYITGTSLLAKGLYK